MGRLVELRELRERRHVFRDRAHAGDVLADLLDPHDLHDGLVLAIPAGGVPVGVALARRHRLELDLAVVSKLTPSWNSEVGYGAVAWDGRVRLNPRLVHALGVDEAEIREGTRSAARKVARRVERFRGGRALPALAGRPVILVDDGLASGFTMRVAVEAAREAGARTPLVAVPTADLEVAEALATEVEAVFCANLRSRTPFAVADAYQSWSDLSDDDVAALLDAHARGN